MHEARTLHNVLEGLYPQGTLRSLLWPLASGSWYPSTHLLSRTFAYQAGKWALTILSRDLIQIYVQRFDEWRRKRGLSKVRSTTRWIQTKMLATVMHF